MRVRALLSACLVAVTPGCIGYAVRAPVAQGERGPATRGVPAAAPGASEVRDLVYVNYAVDPARVRRHVPAPYEVLTRPVAGRARAFVSVVWFRHEDLRAHLPLSPRVDAGEVNLRTYVRNRRTGEEGVWFLDVALTAPVAAVFRAFTGMPARTERCEVTATPGPAGTLRYGLQAAAPEAARRAVVEDLGVAEAPMEGFASFAAARAFLVERHVGYYPRWGGMRHPGRMEVQHAPLALTLGRLAEPARFPLAAKWGLVPAHDAQTPHSIFVSPGARFTVHITYELQPRRTRATRGCGVP